MDLRVTERVSKIRWIFLPLGMCALVAVGTHAAADVVGDKVLFAVDRVDAFFDAIFSSWSVTAPLVDLVGLGERTFFARAVALAWELSADALLAIPLLGYDERAAADELTIARVLVKRRPSLKTLYTSGYTENAIVHHGRLDAGVLLLAKPYRKSDLAIMIRRALNES